jgi:hypothetical protein
MAHDVTPPVVEQEAFQGRADDTETLNSASFDYSLNTNFTQLVDTIFRIRFEIQETAGGDTGNVQYYLQYNHEGGGWNDIGAATPLQWALSGQYAADDAATQVIGDGSYVNGDGVEGRANTGNIALTSQSSESEWAVYIDSAQVAHNETIAVRVGTLGGAALDNYAVNLTITVNEPAAGGRRVFVIS